MGQEIWKVVPSKPGVWASSLGRVRFGEGKPTFGVWAKPNRRFTVFWKAHGRSKVARLVCEAFNGAPPFEGAVCMHLDKDSRNNRPPNLAWGTQRENLNAPGFIGYCRTRRGERHPRRVSANRRKESST
jgi:hypothetical protein